MISSRSRLSLKMYIINLLVHDRNIFGSSSKVFGNLWIFSENVQQRSCDRRTSFAESLEIFRKCLEIFRKSSKMQLSVCLY